MPLVPSPSTGYTDYQTFGNYDSSLLWSIDSFLGTSPVSSPVMNMTKYAALSGFLLCVTNQCQCTITWYGDVGLTELIASRTFTLTSQITSGFGALIMPNMGAYAQVVCSNIGGVAFAVNTLIFGTNRTSPVIWSPQGGAIIDQQNIPIGAATTAFVYPTDYFTGPVFVWQFAIGANQQVALNYLTTTGNWDTIVQQQPLAASTNATYVWVVPSGAWRVVVNNPGAASNYYLSIIPSLAGAS